MNTAGRTPRWRSERRANSSGKETRQLTAAEGESELALEGKLVMSEGEVVLRRSVLMLMRGVVILEYHELECEGRELI